MSIVGRSFWRAEAIRWGVETGVHDSSSMRRLPVFRLNGVRDEPRRLGGLTEMRHVDSARGDRAPLMQFTTTKPC